MRNLNVSSSLNLRASAVLVAAGSGTRMGAERNKVWLELGGEPIVQRSARALTAPAEVIELIVVTRDDEAGAARDALTDIAGQRPVRIVSGGATRAASVTNGVRATDPTADLILIHDAARPFPSPALIRSVLAAAARSGAAIPVLPVVDTLKRVQDGVIKATVDRADLCGAQTPQAFRRGLLVAAIGGRDPHGPAPTDDASWLEGSHAVTTVPGEATNLKITRPDDLTLAVALLAVLATEARR